MTEQLTQDEVSRRIATATRLVYDLYTEVHSLMRMLTTAIEESDLDVVPVTSKNRHFHLPRQKKGPPAALSMQADLGHLYELTSAPVAEDEDEEDEEESEEVETLPVKGRGRMIEVTPDSGFLGIRTCLLDRSRGEDFKPFVVAAGVSELSQAPRGKRKKTVTQGSLNNFKIRRVALARMLRELTPDLTVGGTVTQRIPVYAVTGKLICVKSQPLAAFSTEEDVNTFVSGIVAELSEGAPV